MGKMKRSNLPAVALNPLKPADKRVRANTRLIQIWRDNLIINPHEEDFLLSIRYEKSHYLSDKQLEWENAIHHRATNLDPGAMSEVHPTH